MSDENLELIEKIQKLEDIVEHLSFKQDLIFYDNNVNKFLYEYDINKNQFSRIMDVMDEFETKINNNEPVDHRAFEEIIYEVIPQQKGNYHFAEALARNFWEDRRWEEVFINLYGYMEKYKYYQRGL